MTHQIAETAVHLAVQRHSFWPKPERLLREVVRLPPPRVLEALVRRVDAVCRLGRRGVLPRPAVIPGAAVTLDSAGRRGRLGRVVDGAVRCLAVRLALAFAAVLPAVARLGFAVRRGRCGGPDLRVRPVMAAFIQQKSLNFKPKDGFSDM
ncbi:MAG: hypothetical protein AAF414_12025 [Pseudomonadota bacterium]